MRLFKGFGSSSIGDFMKFKSHIIIIIKIVKIQKWWGRKIH